MLKVTRYRYLPRDYVGFPTMQFDPLVFHPSVHMHKQSMKSMYKNVTKTIIDPAEPYSKENPW